MAHNWTISEIAADIVEGSKYRAPEQISIETKLARRVVVLEAGIRRLNELRNLVDAANEDPKRYGGYQGSTLYGENFDELVVMLVGEQPDITEASADQDGKGESDGSR